MRLWLDQEKIIILSFLHKAFQTLEKTWLQYTSRPRSHTSKIICQIKQKNSAQPNDKLPVIPWGTDKLRHVTLCLWVTLRIVGLLLWGTEKSLLLWHFSLLLYGRSFWYRKKHVDFCLHFCCLVKKKNTCHQGTWSLFFFFLLHVQSVKVVGDLLL